MKYQIPNWLIILAGCGQIFTALIYPYIRHQVFDWYNDGRYIQGLNFCFGLIAILIPTDLKNGSHLALALTTLIGMYWIGKVATQIAYYPMYQIPQKRIFKIGSYFMNTLFVSFAIIYSWLFILNLQTIIN